MNRLIVRSVIIFFICFVLLTVSAVPSKAEDAQNCVQVTQYGGGVGIVCGAKHEPVNTGLADINPLVLSSIFLSLSGFGIYSCRKLLRKEIRFIEVEGGENNE
ncbi:MAG: hypothetical protein Q7T59_01865 [Candidatus Woesebacteria bacterium]|nr:hypothetical protein [Candidatus Woesebacteria bacterium]